MNQDDSITLGSFLLELLIYGIMVVAYFFLVLHFLGDWLGTLYDRHRNGYAAVALLFIVVQGVLLEAVTRLLLGWVLRRRHR